MPAAKKPTPLPKTLAACGDLLYLTRQDRLMVQKDVEAHKDLENRLKEKLINELPKGEASGVAGRVARVSIGTDRVPSLKDWDKLCRWVLKQSEAHKRKKTGLELEPFAVFTRALSKEFIEQSWDNGVEVEGVEPFTVVKVSVNKI